LLPRQLLLCLLCLTGCASQVEKIPSQGLPPEQSAFGRELLDQAAAHKGRSGFRLLPASNEAFAARAELIRAAHTTLDLQYYIVESGLSTRALLHEVLRAADRGVRVRILLDDTTSDGQDDTIATLGAHPNIQIRVFNPLHLGRTTGITRTAGRLFDLSQQHRRMHNKLWLVDGVAAIVGGRNLGDEYFDAEPNMNFTDIDMLAVGPVAHELGQSFDQYWNSALSKPIRQFFWHPPGAGELAALRNRLAASLARAEIENDALYERLMDFQREPRLATWLEELIWAPSQALWDAPTKVLADEPDPHLLLTTQLLPELQGVSRELILISAYFVPTEQGVGYLTARADAGVQVSLLTNALEATDVPAVHGGYAPYRAELLRHGIRLFELRRQPGDTRASGPYSFGSSNSSLHSKAMVFDRKKVFVGSFNFDPRSVLWNTEVGVVVDSPELAERVRELALEGMAPTTSYEVKLQPYKGGERLVWLAEDNGRKHGLDQEPAGVWRRFNAWLSEHIGLEKLL
jgi:putative cardiolipin synthase